MNANDLLRRWAADKALPRAALATLAALAALAALVAPAQAVAKDGPKVAAAKALAAAVWGNPCDGNVSVRWDDLGSEYAANATPSLCVVKLNTRGPGATGGAYDRWSWGWVCTYMLHEYGHLAGMNHSANPHSVMFRQPLMDRRCMLDIPSKDV